MTEAIRGCLPKAMLLDLDDTLVCDDTLNAGCWQEVCERFAGRLDGMTPEALRAAIRQYSAWYWGDPERHRAGRLDLLNSRRAMVAGALRQAGMDAPELATRIADAYSAAKHAACRLVPGAVETLDGLCERGVRLALITNGAEQMQRGKIERFGLARYFDAVVVEGEFGCGKPDERVYRHALERLGAAPGDAWMVGDNLEWDVAAPQRLGIAGVWIDVRGTGLPAGCAVQPYRVIAGIAELIEPYR